MDLPLTHFTRNYGGIQELIYINSLKNDAAFTKKEQKMNEEWVTRVCAACYSGSLDTLKECITSDNVNTMFTYNYFAQTALSLCCIYGREKCVKWLIEQRGAECSKSLITAARHNNITCVAYLLSRSDIDINTEDGHGQTALDVTDHPYILELLLEAGATILRNTFSKYLKVLYRSMRSDDAVTRASECIKVLLQRGVQLKNSILPPHHSHWILKYASGVDKLRIKRAADAGRALLLVLQRKGAPKDMARWCVRKYVMSQWMQFSGVIARKLPDYQGLPPARFYLESAVKKQKVELQ
jgi:hypothetical protein